MNSRTIAENVLHDSLEANVQFLIFSSFTTVEVENNVEEQIIIIYIYICIYIYIYIYIYTYIYIDRQIDGQIDRQIDRFILLISIVSGTKKRKSFSSGILAVSLLSIVGVILQVVIIYLFCIAIIHSLLIMGRNKPQVPQSLQLQDFYPPRFFSDYEQSYS